MNDREYLGYRIEIRRAGGLSAIISGPGLHRPVTETRRATLEEGEGILLNRARAFIDQHEKRKRPNDAF
jgi:hypothetical protein